MARPRVPLGLEASRTSLDGDVCTEIGRRLREARTAKGASVADAAKALMFSPAQVTALETVQLDAFYGADFYTNALRKYLSYLNLPATEADRALVKPPDHAQKTTPFRRKTVAEATPKVARRPALAPTVVAAAVAASAVAGWWMLAPKRPTPATASSAGTTGSTGAEPAEPPSPAQPASVPPAGIPSAAPANPTAGEPAAVEISAANAAASAVSAVSSTLSPVIQASELASVSNEAVVNPRHGAVTVTTSTWVFVRYTDNAADERRLGAGETFAFRSQPVYIAVGTAAGTTIVLGGRAINTEPFTTNGQIRIGKAFLGTFVAGR